MLGKLIKYEFRATRRVMLPIMAAIVLLSVLAGAAMHILDMPDAPAFIEAIAGMTFALFFFGLFGMYIVALVQMIERFYRNLLSDEGYLMFTLPTNADRLIISKLIVSFVWFTLTGLLCFVGLALMFTVSSAVIDWSFMDDFKEAIREALEYIWAGNKAVGAGHITGWVLELVVAGFLGTAALCLRFYLAMAIGFSFDEHKKLLSVVFYFLIGIAVGVIRSAFLSIFVENGIIENWIMQSEFSAGLVHGVLLGSVGLGLIAAVIYYLPTSLLLKKKLNLP